MCICNALVQPVDVFVGLFSQFETLHSSLRKLHGESDASLQSYVIHFPLSLQNQVLVSHSVGDF